MNHEKLTCYRTLVGVAEELDGTIRRWPKGYGYLVDQTRRAVASAVLNLAEGNGKCGGPERQRFFQISLGSVAETAACVDLAAAFCLIPAAAQEGLKSRLRDGYRMIRKLP